MICSELKKAEIPICFPANDNNPTKNPPIRWIKYLEIYLLIAALLLPFTTVLMIFFAALHLLR